MHYATLGLSNAVIDNILPLRVFAFLSIPATDINHEKVENFRPGIHVALTGAFRCYAGQTSRQSKILLMAVRQKPISPSNAHPDERLWRQK